VIVSGTALAATTGGGWYPTLGSPDRGTPPIAAGASVPADQLAALSILRRPQIAADRGPRVRQALTFLDRRIINGIHTDAIRVIFQTPREIAILVPAERFGPQSHPESLVRHGLCLMSASKSAARTMTVTRHGKPTKIRFPAGFAGWGSSCGDLETLRTSGIATGTSPDPSGGLIINGYPRHPTLRRVVLVPDGVARVTVRLRHGRSVTVPVRDNVYRYTTTESPASMGAMWFDADGKRIDHRRNR
jgi:hypothetical protein